jgi:hypothetical protein
VIRLVSDCPEAGPISEQGDKLDVSHEEVIKNTESRLVSDCPETGPISELYDLLQDASYDEVNLKMLRSYWSFIVQRLDQSASCLIICMPGHGEVNPNAEILLVIYCPETGPISKQWISLIRG